jgi:hypothetical protein
MRRHRGGQEPNGIQPKLPPAALGQQKVAVVNRIECAAENAKFHGYQFSVFSYQLSVISLQFTVYSLQFTVYSNQF